MGKFVHVELGRHEKGNDFSGNHHFWLRVCVMSLDEMVNPEHFGHAKECQVWVVLPVLGRLSFPFLQLGMDMLYLQTHVQAATNKHYIYSTCVIHEQYCNLRIFHDKHILS